MFQRHVVRTSLFVLVAVVFTGYQTKDALAQDGSHTLAGTSTSLQNLAGRVRVSRHNSSLKALGVSYSATSCCMQTGQRRDVQPNESLVAGTPHNADGALESENHSLEPNTLATGDTATSRLLVGLDNRATRRIEDLIRLLPPSVDIPGVPQPEPVRSAISLVLGNDSQNAGGLWVSGDVTKAIELLRWLAGDQLSELVYLDGTGRVGFRQELLASESGGDKLDRINAALVIADYILSHEGLLLVTELTQGKERYLLHVGNSAPTMGEHVRVSSTINLDLNYDSRINPRRPNGQKVREEKPPEGFDSLVAVNPATRWLSLQNKRLVPLESVVLHELAEAHAKVALGLDYLPKEGRVGAHNLAIERESRFALQRPTSGSELTSGWIRVVGAEDQ